jgi:pyruvate dehydrogenase E2 component (dihydrolipoamide acetyltransferase)
VATKVVMPKLSDTMSEGTINEWLKKEGDRVEAGEALATVETDKATMELESYSSGVLRKVLVPAGGVAPVGDLIAVIAEANEDIDGLLAEAGGGKPAGKAEAQAAPAPKGEPAKAGPARPPAEPVATAPGPKPDPKAGGLKVPPTERPTMPQAAGTPPSPGSGTTVQAAAYDGGGRRNGVAAEGGRVKASPLARRIAEAKGIDLAAVAGSGPGGRVIKRDIEAWQPRPQPAAARPAAQPAPAAKAQPAQPALVVPRPAAPVTGPTPYEDRPATSMRKVIAQRMVESKTTVPHFYLTAEVDMDRAVEMRTALVAAAPDIKVTYTDMILKACGLALARHPQVNASFMGDRVRYWQRADIGLAVALEEGLITPIVTGCDVKSLGQIALEARALAERARARQLKPEEYQGGSFSVSNLGMYDVEEFGAIINPPQGAILAVGAVVKRPVVKADGALGVGHRMRLTLSCDHRVVDGAVGAAFLRDVKRLLEQPATLAL